MNPNPVNRKPLFIVGGVIAGVMALFLIIGFLMPKKGTLSITAPVSAPINVTIVSDDAAFNRTTLIDAASTQQFSLDPGSYRVESTASSLKSIDIVTINAEKNTKLAVSFAAASTATKIATGLDYCPYVLQEKVYDYDCQSYGFIYEQNGLEETKSILFDSQWFDYLVAYRDGFLGFPIDGELHYVNLLTQQMTAIKLPADLQGDDARSLMKISTSPDPTKSYFAISYADDNAVYIFQDITDTSPKRLKLPRDDFMSRANYMDWEMFSGDTLLVYAGPTDEAEDGTLSEPEAHVPRAGGKIVEYNLSGTVTRTIDTPTGFYPDRVIKLTDKYYASNRIEGVEFFYLDGKKLESIHKIPEVVTSVPINDTLYIEADNDIYLFQPGDKGSFSIKSTYTPADNEKLNGIYPGPGYLIFTATPSGKEVANVYRLDN